MSNKPVFWKQANGKLVSVDEMDINHLRNVLKMILSTTTKKVYSGIIVQSESLNDKKPNLDYRFNDDEARGNQW